jgi:hypothetical protein
MAAMTETVTVAMTEMVTAVTTMMASRGNSKDGQQREQQRQ